MAWQSAIVRRTKLLLCAVLVTFQLTTANANEPILTPSDAHNRLEAGIRAFNAERYGDAFDMLMSLAIHGHPIAMYLIGLMYAEGFGVDASREHAYLWLEEASEAGVIEAIYTLGAIIYSDQSRIRDTNRAITLINYAHKMGFHIEQFLIDELVRDGTADFSNSDFHHKWMTIDIAE